jgi:hypothetical protein
MAHPEALETHPGVVGAHPGTVDCGVLLVIYYTWNSCTVH